jgi:hypothetical protein
MMRVINTVVYLCLGTLIVVLPGALREREKIGEACRKLAAAKQSKDSEG